MEVTDRLPSQLRAPFRQVAGELSATLWLWPAIGGVVGVAVAAVLITLDPTLPFELPFLSIEASRAAITTIVGSTIAAVSLVVTGTIVALQLATGQYSPRLLRDALQDQGLQLSLSLLIGTVTYELALVPRLGGEAAPVVAVLVGIAGGFVGVAMLVLFLQRIIERLRLETIIREVVTSTRRAIESTHAPDEPEGTAEIPQDAVPLPARRSGYIQDVSLEALAEVACEHGLDIHLRPRIGAFLVAGTVVAHVWPTPDEAEAPDETTGDRDVDSIDAEGLADEVDGVLALGVDRTITRDPDYGIRHLVDIALRAVSPGINDPTTAVQCIDHITGLLVELANHVTADWVVRRDGSTATVRHPDLASHVELARTQILHYGGDDPWVLAALVRQLRDLLQAGDRVDVPHLVRDHLDIVVDHVERLDPPPHERRVVDAAIGQVEDLLAGRLTEEDDTAAG